MNQNDLKWYRDNGFPETVVTTAAETTALVEKYYEIEFDEMFISNVLKEGQEEYPSLWLFTERDVVECKNFLNRFDIDIVRYKDNVRYVNIITDKKDTIINPSSSSKMKLAVLLIDDSRCVFDAIGANCQRLSGIAKRYLREYKGGR